MEQKSPLRGWVYCAGVFFVLGFLDAAVIAAGFFGGTGFFGAGFFGAGARTGAGA
jgi:hypothetical protein